MNRTFYLRALFAFILPCCLLWLARPASAQYVVDCSGNTPGAYTSINSVLPLVTNGSSILVSGVCNENVSLTGLEGVSLGAQYGQTMNLQGSLTITGSQNLFIYGMNVSNSSGDGIDIENSQGIEIDSCISSGNDGRGIYVDGGSDVSIQDTGSYDNNASSGVYVTGNSLVQLTGWGGLIDISDNLSSGLYAERSVVSGSENISIDNNQSVPGAIGVSGFGVDFRGGARGILLGIFAPMKVEGNQGGGISLQENSEISLGGGSLLPGIGQPVILQGNGPTGVSVGFGSQLTMYDGVQITGHTDTGVDVYGNGQAYIYGTNRIANNGFDRADPARAGVRVDGNSEAYLRGTQISGNGGPGLLALVNSSLDFSGVTFSSNTGGTAACDSSSYMAGDLDGASLPTGANPGTGPGASAGALSPCRAPSGLQSRSRALPSIQIPDVSRYKADENRYRRIMSALH